MQAIQLPEPEYYAINELAARWQCHKKRIEHFVETGRLYCCVKLKSCMAQIGKMIYHHNGKISFLSKETKLFSGFVQLFSEDSYWIFRYGKIQCQRFLSLDNRETTLQLIEEEEFPIIAKKDLVIFRKEVLRFEQCYAGQNLQGRNKEEHEPNQAFRFSEDYQIVRFKGIEFRFGKMQAAVIRQLHEASLTSQPSVHGKILLKKAGSSSTQLRSVFRSKANWRNIIISDGQGYYRLAS